MNLSELIERLQVYFQIILHRKWLIFLLALVAGVGLGLRAWLAPKQFIATTVFHPDTGDGGASPGMQIPDPLTFLMGTQGGGTSGQQIVGVLKSRSLSERIMADSILWMEDSMLLADVVIEQTPSSFSPIRIIRSLFVSNDSGPTLEGKIIQAGARVRSRVNTEMTEEGLIRFTVGYYHSQLTQILAGQYITHLEKYYTQQKTEKAKRNVEFFTLRADSVKKELDQAAASRARIMDEQQYRVYARDQIRAAELDIKLQMLQEMYIQQVASREQFIAQLKRETPVIQVLDPPKPPFVVIAPSPLIHFLIGFFLVGLLLSLWLTRSLLLEDGKQLLFSALNNSEDAEEEE